MADDTRQEQQEHDQKGMTDLFQLGILNNKDDEVKLQTTLRTFHTLLVVREGLLDQRSKKFFEVNGMEKKATWKMLRSYFSQFPNHQIRTLDLCLHENAFWAFEPFFERLETIKMRLDMDPSQTYYAAISDDSVVELPSLQTLHISSSTSKRIAGDIDEPFPKIRPPPNFFPSILSASTRLVDLSYRPVVPRDLECFGKIVQANPLLQRLSCAIKTDFSPENNTLATAIRHHKSLQSISIFLMGRASPSIETQRIVETSLLWTPKLQEFAFGMDKDVELGEWIVECLANTRIVTFRYVRNMIFWENDPGPIDGDGVRSIMDGLTRNQTIQTIDVMAASFGVADDDRKALLLAQHPTLQTLRFNHYNQTTIAKVFSVLAKSRTIKSIECHLLERAWNCTDLVRHLGQGLEGNKTLESIKIKLTDVRSVWPELEAVVVFCRALASHPTLRHFVFPSLTFGAHQKHAKEAVRRSTALEEMKIQWRQNGWPPGGCPREIEAMLATNAVLNNNFLAPTGQETNEVLLPHILAKASHRNIDLTYRCVRDRVCLFVQALFHRNTHDASSESEELKKRKRGGSHRSVDASW